MLAFILVNGNWLVFVLSGCKVDQYKVYDQ